MDWGQLAQIATVVVPTVSGVGWIVTQRVDRSVANLRAQIAEWRANDKEEIRRDLNGSFMRAGEAHARFDGMDRRLETIENKLDASHRSRH